MAERLDVLDARCQPGASRSPTVREGLVIYRPGSEPFADARASDSPDIGYYSRDINLESLTFLLQEKQNERFVP